MSMDIWIGDNGWWSTTSGIFECIVEETRSLFNDNEQECFKKVYMPLDEWYQGYIDLRELDEESFNLFYKYCKKAMINFPDSERGKVPDKEYLAVILGQWYAVLRIMREDPRYRGQPSKTIQAGDARQIAILEKIREEIQEGKVVDIPLFHKICSDYTKDHRHVGGYFSPRNAGATLGMLRDNGGYVEITPEGEKTISDYIMHYENGWLVSIDGFLRNPAVLDTETLTIP